MGDTILGSRRAGAAVTSIVGQVTHTSTLPDRPIRQSNAEQLHPSVGAGPGVVAVVAAMRAPPRHDQQLEQRINKDPKPDRIRLPAKKIQECIATRQTEISASLFSHDPKQTEKGFGLPGGQFLD